MDRESLEKLSINELKKIAEKLDIKPSKRKGELINQIRNAFREWEDYKKDKVERYTRISVLGNKGREARTFLVYDKKRKIECAQKCYRKNKASQSIRREYEFQDRASKKGISPAVIDIDTISKTITMEKMEYDLVDLIQRQKGKLTRKQQEDIIKLLDRLDDIGIFHADGNSLNFMYTKDNVLQIIDYGFAEEITPKVIKKFGTKFPNRLYITMGLISQFHSIFPESKFVYLEKQVDPKLLEKYKDLNCK